MLRWIKTAHIILIYFIAIVAIFRHDLVIKAGKLFTKSPVGFDFYMGMMEAQKAQNPANCVVFIGDSLIKDLDVSAVADGPALNFGIGGDTTGGLIWRLTQFDKLNLSKAIVLEIGINDLRQSSDDKIVSNYGTILGALPSDKPVIVSSILPVIEKKPYMFSMHYKVENARIRNINKQVKEICRKYSNVTFVDAFDSLCDETDSLQKEFTTDGIHLSPQGYGIWTELLKNNIQRALEN